MKMNVALFTKWFAENIERLIIDGVLKVGQPLPQSTFVCEKSASHAFPHCVKS